MYEYCGVQGEICIATHMALPPGAEHASHFGGPRNRDAQRLGEPVVSGGGSGHGAKTRCNERTGGVGDKLRTGSRIRTH
jgi:hypothetical protein